MCLKGEFMTFGEKLKDLRTKEGFTQKDLGEKLNVTAQAISRWENNEVEPSLSMLTTLSEMFKVSIDVLLGKDEPLAKIEMPERKEEVKKPQTVKPRVVFTNSVQQQKPVLATCEMCNNAIFESADLKRVNVGGRHHRTHIYCHDCNDSRLKKIKEAAEFEGRRKRVRSFWLGGLATAVVLTIGLWATIPSGIAMNIVYASIIGLLCFPFVSCLILDNNFVGEMVGTVFDWGFVRMPGLIFSLDLDGIIWLLTVKLLFWIIGLLLAVVFGLLGLSLGLVVSLFVYPFALRKNILRPDAD